MCSNKLITPQCKTHKVHNLSDTANIQQAAFTTKSSWADGHNKMWKFFVSHLGVAGCPRRFHWLLQDFKQCTFTYTQDDTHHHHHHGKKFVRGGEQCMAVDLHNTVQTNKQVVYKIYQTKKVTTWMWKRNLQLPLTSIYMSALVLPWRQWHWFWRGCRFMSVTFCTLCATNIRHY